MVGRSSSAAPDSSSRRPPTGGVGQLLLRLVTAAMLGLDSHVHLHDRGFYTGSRGGAISQGRLFVLEAAVAAVAAVLLILGWRLRVARRADWLAAFLVAASALAAVLLYRYVDVGRIGPLPDMYEPTWQVPGKLLSGYAEAAAAVLSMVGLTLPPSRSLPSASQGWSGQRSHRRAC